MPRKFLALSRHGDCPATRNVVSLRQKNRGFTLVELMVAMALLGALTSIIYGLFHTTSQTLLEVESLAETTDTARFALEHVRNDLQAAGSQATPRGQNDPWVVQDGLLVNGLVTYNGWQGNAPIPNNATATTEFTNANRKSRFDGFVVIGAYDIPQPVMIRDINTDGAITADVAKHVRGVSRLVNSDPFDISFETPDSANLLELLTRTRPDEEMPRRLLRITDRQGFFQFTRILGASIQNSTVQLTLERLQAATGESLVGIDEVNDNDVEYEAAFLDAFWYHVIVDPHDPLNFQLVRDRLDASQINFNDLNNFVPTAAVSASGTPVERVVIANRVVDFRLWFDCANAVTGQVTDINWHSEWESPVTSPTSSINGCLETQIQLARVAHIRLSIRTANESANRKHLSVVQDWPGFEDANARMQTYDIEPSVPGAASVITMQSTVELSNFAMRNLRTH